LSKAREIHSGHAKETKMSEQNNKAKKRFNVIVFDKIPANNGNEPKILPRTVGQAVQYDNDNIELFLPEGIAIYKRCTLSPWKSKDETESDTQ
jgi:hypothetical protein